MGDQVKASDFDVMSAKLDQRYEERKRLIAIDGNSELELDYLCRDAENKINEAQGWKEQTTLLSAKQNGWGAAPVSLRKIISESENATNLAIEATAKLGEMERERENEKGKEKGKVAKEWPDPNVGSPEKHRSYPFPIQGRLQKFIKHIMPSDTHKNDISPQKTGHEYRHTS